MIKMFTALLVEEVADPWQPLYSRLVSRHFAVKNSQRIRYDPALTVITHSRHYGAQSSAQLLIENSAAVRTSDRVQF